MGVKSERLLDSEGRIDAFLEPPTQEQTETLVEAVRSGAERAATSSPPEGEAGDGGASTAAIAGIGVAGLLVGLLGGALAGRRRF